VKSAVVAAVVQRERGSGRNALAGRPLAL